MSPREYKSYRVAYRCRVGVSPGREPQTWQTRPWRTLVVTVSAFCPTSARILARLKLEREYHAVVGKHVSTELRRKKPVYHAREDEGDVIPLLALYAPDQDQDQDQDEDQDDDGWDDADHDDEDGEDDAGDNEGDES